MTSEGHILQESRIYTFGSTMLEGGHSSLNHLGATIMIKWTCIGLVIVVLVSLTAATTTDFPYPENGIKKVDKLLDDMTDDQLELYLDGLRLQLITDVYKDYEQLLKKHDKTIEGLQTYKKSGRQRRHEGFNDEHHGEPIIEGLPFQELPNLHDGVWHSYTFDTGIKNRRIIKIDNFRAESLTGNQKISASYTLQMGEIPAILRDHTTGYGYTVGSESLKPLYALNQYTKSTTGCQCVDGKLHDCACCYPGSTICRTRSDICAPFGQDVECPFGHENVELNAAVAFKYHLEGIQGTESSSQNFVITANGNYLNFYNSVKGDLRSTVISTGYSYQNFSRTVTHLGYGETLIESHFTSRKKRFLFTFSARAKSQDIYEISIHKNINNVGLWYIGSWDCGDGAEDMKVIQEGARMLIFVKSSDRIKIYEYKMDRFHHGFRMHLFSEVKFLLSAGVSFVGWHVYKNHYKTQIIIHYTNKCITYHLRGNNFDMDSIIQPEGQLTQFDAVMPIKISHCDDQTVLLAVQGTYGLVFVWDGSAGAYKSATQINVGVSGISWSAAVSWTLSTETQIIVPTPMGMTRMYLLGHLQDIPNPVYGQNRIIMNHMNIIEIEFKRQLEIEDRTVLAIHTAHEVIENPVFRGNITILKKINIVKHFVTHVLQNTTIMIINQLMFEEAENTLNLTVNPLITEIRQTIIKIQNILEDAVSISGSEIKISGTKHFHGSIQVNNEAFYKIKANDVQCSDQQNEMSIRIEKIVKKDYTGVVHGKKTFRGGITIMTLYADYLDDIAVSDIVTTSKTQIITGATFNTIVEIQGELTFGSGFTLAGIDLGQVVTITGTHTLGTIKSFKLVTIEYCYVNIVDGININIFLFNTLTNIGPVTIQGSLEILGHFTVTVNTEATTVMNVNFNQYLLDVVYLVNPADITGALTFNSLVTIYGSMNVYNFINGKVFPDEFLIQGPKVNFLNAFFQFAIFNEIDVLGYVDTVKVSHLVTITTNQVIKDIKKFKLGIHVKNDIHLQTGLIDGFNITAYRPSTTVLSYNTFTFLQHVTVDILAYTELFNRINLKAVTEDFVYTDEGSVQINSVKHFSKGLIALNVNLQSTLNGQGLHTFVKTNSRQSIYGHKILRRESIFSRLIVEGDVDGVHLLSLIDNAVYLNRRNQVITGVKRFTKNIVTTRIKVQNSINDIVWTRFVTLTRSFTFNSHQIFNHVISSTVNLKHIVCNVGVKIATIDISEYVRLRVLLDGSNQNIGTIIVAGQVSASLVTAVTVNHVNMNIFLSNLCYKYENIVISSSSEIRFKYLNVVGLLTTINSNGANGISLALLAQNAVYLYMDNTFNVDSFWVKILADDITVYGMIDGIHIKALAYDAVYIYDGLSPCIEEGCNIISGKKIFKGKMSIEGNIEADWVNDIDLGKDLFTKGTHQKITGQMNFTSVTAQSTVHLYGDFNECLNPIFGNSVHFQNQNGEFSAYVDVIFHDAIYAKAINVIGTFNEMHIDAVLQTAIRLDQKIELNEEFTFEAAVTFVHLYSTYLNSLEWKLFISDLILSNQTYNFNSNVEVDGSFIVQTCSVSNNFILMGTIDGIYIKDLIDGAVYINQDYEFDMTWEVSNGAINVYDGLTVDLINGISVSQFVTTNTVQTFTSSMVTFDTCSTMGYNILVSGFVNSIILLEEYHKTWFNRSTALTGFKSFTGHVVVRGDVNVDGGVTEEKINLQLNVIYINNSLSTHNIEGRIVFLQPLKVIAISSLFSDVLINSVNLVEIKENAWFKDVQTTITSSFTFNKKTKFKTELQTVTSIINSVDVWNVYFGTNTTIMEYNSQIMNLKTNYSMYCRPSLMLCEVLEAAIHELDYMEEISTLTLEYEQHASYSFKVSGMTFLLMTWKDRCETTIYRWDAQNLRFVIAITFESGLAHNWDSFPSSLNENINLVMSADEDNFCIRKNSAVWEFEAIVVQNSVIVSVTMVQELQAGWTVSIINTRHNPVLHIYSSTNTTYHYSYSVEKTFELVNQDPVRFSKYVYAFDKNDNEIGFEVQLFLRNSIVKVYINGVFESSHFCGGMTTDAVVVEQHGNVRLILLVDENVLSLKSYTLNIKYLVAFSLEDETNATMKLISYTVVNGGDFMLTFTAGGLACECPLVTVFSSSYDSVTYAFQGDEFSLWTTMPLSISENIWGVPFSVSRQDRIDEKLLMYSYNKKKALIMAVRLKGSSQIDTSMTCDADDSLPLLGYYT